MSEEVTDVENDIAPSWVRRIEEAQAEAKKNRSTEPGAEQRHEEQQEGDQ